MLAHLDDVLAEVKRARGIDLSGYRRGTLERRLAARMEQVGCEDTSTYLNRLRTDPSECDRLIDTVGVNVSSFFRDSLVFEIISKKILPEILARKRQTTKKPTGGKKTTKAGSSRKPDSGRKKAKRSGASATNEVQP